jgi:hypothetical protein
MDVVQRHAGQRIVPHCAASRFLVPQLVVWVGSDTLPLCYLGGYVSSTGTATLTWPNTGFGAAANESYTFTTPGTYALGLWQANSDASGYSLGALLATTTLTVQEVRVA